MGTCHVLASCMVLYVCNFMRNYHTKPYKAMMSKGVETVVNKPSSACRQYFQKLTSEIAEFYSAVTTNHSKG